jgi:hypothetical protein
VPSKAGAHVCWIARLLPQPPEWPKFLCAKDSGGPPWMMPNLYDRRRKHRLSLLKGQSRRWRSHWRATMQ